MELSNLYNDKDTYDFWLKIDNVVIGLHKLLLIQTSPFFKQMLCGSFREDTGLTKDNPLEMKEVDIDTFEIYRYFIYHNNLDDKDLSIDSIIAMLNLGHRFQNDKFLDIIHTKYMKFSDVKDWLLFYMKIRSFEWTKNTINKTIKIINDNINIADVIDLITDEQLKVMYNRFHDRKVDNEHIATEKTPIDDDIGKLLFSVGLDIMKDHPNLIDLFLPSSHASSTPRE